MFAQAERASDHPAGGLVVGLALVKNLVELHGAEVSAASDGTSTSSRFNVVLPLLGTTLHA